MLGFVSVAAKTDGTEIFVKDEWELIFFETRSRARLVRDGDVRFKSIEFSCLEELFTLLGHDPVFRGEVLEEYGQVIF